MNHFKMTLVVLLTLSFAGVLEKVWGKVKPRNSQKEELKNMLIPEKKNFMKTPLLIHNKVNDFIAITKFMILLKVGIKFHKESKASLLSQ